MKAFYQLFAMGIQTMHSAEKQIVKALPNLIQAAKEPKLKDVFRSHLEESEKQVERLEEIAEELDIKLTKGHCLPMQALIAEGDKCAKLDYSHEVRDAALIGAAQCVEHYEIAMYGTLKTFACVLKLDRAEELLGETLEEEKEADQKLTEIADGTFFSKGINEKAGDREEE